MNRVGAAILLIVLMLFLANTYAADEACPLLQPPPSVLVPAPRDTPGGGGPERRPKYSASIDHKQIIPMDGSTYAVITHSEKNFDKDKTADGVKRLLQTTRQSSIPSIAILNNLYNDQHFNMSEIDEKVESGNGDHKLWFPNATEFIIGGGNLSYCLCETIRDLIRGADSKRGLRLILVTDAIYDLYGAPGYLDRSKPFAISSCTTTATKQLYKHLVQVFTGNDKVCGEYVSFTTTPLKTDGLGFRFSMNGQPLGPSVGSGKRTIDIELTPSTGLASVLAPGKARAVEKTVR